MGWWATIRETFDPRALAYLASVYLGLKGGGGGLLRMAMLPLFKGWGNVGSEAFQAYSIVIMAPWALKPLAGLADKYPLKKEWGGRGGYVVIAAVVGTAATAMLARNAKRVAEIPNTIAALATAANAQIATTDLLAEGTYAALMRDAPGSGSALVSFVWGLAFVAQVLVAAVAGPVADDGNAHLLVAAAVPLMAQAAIPPLAGWTKTKTNSGTEPGTEPVQPWMLKMVATVVGATIATTIAAVQPGPAVKLATAAAVVGGVAAAAWTTMPKRLRGVAVYTFAAVAAQLQFGGPLDYFYTADEQCVAGGPAFTMTFYLTTASLAAAVCGAAGVAAFEATISGWSFRAVFRATTLMMCAVATVDIAIVARANIAAGISDKLAYLGGNACLGAVVMMMHTIPTAVLTSKMCPKGAEAMVYAIVAGMQNLGAAVGGIAGAGIAELAGISLGAAKCEYARLPAVLAAGTIALPALVALPLTWCLIPAKIGMKDQLQA